MFKVCWFVSMGGTYFRKENMSWFDAVQTQYTDKL
jgi:hypothetical protein